MQLEVIVSMANERSRLSLLALERSLRNVGCDLPLRVIPFDDACHFDLPPNATWWKIPELYRWLDSFGSNSFTRKYQALLMSNFHYVDSDICFLENPQKRLADIDGFVALCNEWRDSTFTVTPASKEIFADSNTTWQLKTFNAGHYACDRALYDLETLQSTASSAELFDSCLHHSLPHDQMGTNLLVLSSGVKITNLTLPPYCQQSTFAIDYEGDPEKYWRQPNQRPYLIHWAGRAFERERPIHEIFYSYLTAAEKQEWREQLRARHAAVQNERKSLRGRLRPLKRACRSFLYDLRSVYA